MLEFVSKLHWLWILQVIYLSIKNSSYFFGLSKLFRSYFFYCFLQHFSFFSFFYIKNSLKYHVFVLTKTLYIL